MKESFKVITYKEEKELTKEQIIEKLDKILK